MSQTTTAHKRTHYCGELTDAHIGQTVSLAGWVNKQRRLQQLVFIVLCDRTGLVQLCIDEKKVPPELYTQAVAIRGEYVISAKGIVTARGDNKNPDMPTGFVEIDVTDISVLASAQVPPFSVADADVGMDMRLKYRYIDLRRPVMQNIFAIRHKTALAVRNFLSEQGFLEIETPMLMRSTPEGARDYVVPSRLHEGAYYALPQSPQLLKQLLMASGFDKYFQLARCFRDEDLRADRQPEFTQIDIEMSFVDEADVQSLTEAMICRVFEQTIGVQLTRPFPRISWQDSMRRYGTDKPDIRFGMELVDVTDAVRTSDFPPFRAAIDAGGVVRGIAVADGAAMSRKEMDRLSLIAKDNKAPLMWMQLSPDGIKSPLTKNFAPEQLAAIATAAGAQTGDAVLMCPGTFVIASTALGALRAHLGSGMNLSGYAPLWITEFPLLTYSEEDGRFYAEHHPFTAYVPQDEPLLATAPEKARARIYDLVINGYEIGGGSIRIHQADVQERVLKLLGFTQQAAHESFGFFLEALKYGVPPHGGIALGLDRLVMILTGAASLREVIAFPKVKDASCPLTEAPGALPGE